MFPNLDLTTEEEKHLFKLHGGKMAFIPGLFEVQEISVACVIGEYNVQKNNSTRAIKFFEKCIELYKKNIRQIEINLCDFPPDMKESFLKSVKTSYYASIFDIANCYYHGIGVPVDYDKAFPLFKKAADEYDDADAQNMLGIMYNGGLGVTADKKLSVEYYEKAAIQGNMFAQNSMGRICEFERKDIQKAIYWYKQAAEQGDDLAAENLMRVQGADIPVDGSWKIPGTDIKAADVVPEILKKMIEDADNGDFEAQEALAESYLLGQIVPLDKEKGIELFKKYSDAGNPYTQYNLGVMYNTGNNVPLDKAKAFHYFKLAAKQGIISAKYNLASAYFSALGTEENVRKSFRWMQSAAKDGHPDAQYRLGVYFNFEIGCKFDRHEMIYWMTKAAQQGHYYAQRNLITFCQTGVISDNATLRKWTDALRQNHEGNKGYSKPITKLGEIPNIKDYDAEDKNYKMPKEIIDDPLEWLGPLPEKYQKKIFARSPLTLSSLVPFASSPAPKNYSHHKPKKKTPRYSNKYRRKRK